MEELDVIEEPEVGHVENNELVKKREVLVVEGSNVEEVIVVFGVSLCTRLEILQWRITLF